MLYQLAILGYPSKDQLDELREIISRALAAFEMKLNKDVGWTVGATGFTHDQRRSTAAVYYGSPTSSDGAFAEFQSRGLPILPVASTSKNVSAEIPTELRHLNCLFYDNGGAARVASTLLECIGLLPRQRRVFLSYRRNEARGAALQLFDAFSSRLFDVFLDTHGIPLAEDFQAVLWHRLSDSDVLVMLDTPNYFESRWTNAEFGRALSKGISVLRIGWPDSTPSARTHTASRAELLPEEIDAETGRLSDAAIDRICNQLEIVRSQSRAVRTINLISNLRLAIEKIGGRVTGIGLRQIIHMELPDGTAIAVHPSIGVPTSSTLEEAVTSSGNRPVAIAYDHIGLHPNWLNHLGWLGEQIRSARWIRASEASWQLAGWGT